MASGDKITVLDMVDGVLAHSDLSDVDDNTILNKLKNVDGNGSGLDADLWQGYNLTNAPVGIGVGQTWQDVSASRDAGTTYTNDTGKPIALSLQSYGDDSDGSDLKIVVDGVDVARSAVDDGTGTDYCSGFAIIPNGSTYSGNTVNRGGTLVWLELR